MCPKVLGNPAPRDPLCLHHEWGMNRSEGWSALFCASGSRNGLTGLLDPTHLPFYPSTPPLSLPKTSGCRGNVTAATVGEARQGRGAGGHQKGEKVGLGSDPTTVPPPQITWWGVEFLEPSFLGCSGTTSSTAKGLPQKLEGARNCLLFFIRPRGPGFVLQRGLVPCVVLVRVEGGQPPTAV